MTSPAGATAAGAGAAAAGAGAAVAGTGAVAFPSMFTIEPFDRNKSKWSRWVKRFEGALDIFDVPPASRKAMLLYYMGAETYNLLCDHLAPAEPENKTYQDIVRRFSIRNLWKWSNFGSSDQGCRRKENR